MNVIVEDKSLGIFTSICGIRGRIRGVVATGRASRLQVAGDKTMARVKLKSYLVAILPNVDVR